MSSACPVDTVFFTLRPEQLSAMVYVPPPPLLVVRSHDPQGRWRWLLLTVLAWLSTAALQRGIHQYLQILVGRARIEGITLEGSATPLVQ